MSTNWKALSRSAQRNEGPGGIEGFLYPADPGRTGFRPGVQQHLLPVKLPSLRNGYRRLYEPAGKVGGDLYDVIPLDNENGGHLIFDVSGHGLPRRWLRPSGNTASPTCKGPVPD